MIPTPEDCHKDACSSPDQMFARILRRWVALPFGLSNERYSNHAWLRVAVESFICHINKSADDSTLHEYWCDGVDFVEWKIDALDYFFGGACYISDRHAGTEWLAPFELRIEYDPTDLDCPREVDLRFGHRDPVERLSKKYVAGREHRLYLLAHSLYGSRPTKLEVWAAHVHLLPYVLWLPEHQREALAKMDVENKRHDKI